MNSVAFRGGVGTAVARTQRKPSWAGVGMTAARAARPLANRGFHGGAAPFVTPPAAPSPASPPPAAPAAPTPPAPATPSPDPRDAQFFHDIASGRFSTDSQINALNQSSAYERAALTEALRRLSEQQPRDEQSATHSANAGGLLYSGALGRQIGDIRTDFLRRRSDAQTEFDRSESGRRSEIARLQGLQRLAEDQALLDAIGRQTQRDAEAPLAAPEPPAGYTPDGVRVAGSTTSRFRSGVARNGVDIGILDQAMKLVGRRMSRAQMADLMRANPDWGPYTLANGGRVRGHSVAF